MASHRAWLSVGQLSRQLFQSARYVRPNSVAPDNHESRTAPAEVSSCLPLFTSVPPPALPSTLSSRRLGTSLPLGKQFKEAENDFAYGVMSRLPGYQRTLHYHLLQEGCAPVAAADSELRPTAGWAAWAAQSLLAGVDQLSLRQGSPSPRPGRTDAKDGLDEIVAGCGQFSDSEIIRLLAALLSWPSQVLSLRRLWRALDAECCRRLPEWSTDQVLLVADLLYRLRLLRLTRYGPEMLASLGSRLHSLTPSQLVQYLFFINLARRMHAVSQLDLEQCILDCLPLLSVDEVGIICMGFFKTQTRLQSEQLLEALVEMLIQRAADAKPETVCALLKLLRLSVPSRRWQLVLRVYDKLLPLVHTFNSLTQMHLLLLGTQLIAHHRRAVHTITALLHGQLSTLRLKDIERLMFVTMLFNYDPGPGFLADVAEELRSPRRSEERHLYPKSLMSCLMYLAYHQACPLDLATNVLQPQFLGSLQGSMASYSGCKRELLALNTTLQLDLPGFTSQLPIDYQRNIAKEVMSRLPGPGLSRLTNGERGLLSLQSALAALAGRSDRVAILHLLPAFVTPDLVMCLDERGQALPLPATLQSQSPLDVKPAPVGGRWCAVAYGNRQCYGRNDKRPTGNFLLRLRLLTRLGYHVVEVPWFEFQSQSAQARSYLRRKLQLPPQQLQQQQLAR